jgi:hypothetical protein
MRNLQSPGARCDDFVVLQHSCFFACRDDFVVGQVVNLPLEFLHFSSRSSPNQGLIVDLEAERSE